MLKFDGCNTDEQHYQYGACYSRTTNRPVNTIEQTNPQSYPNRTYLKKIIVLSPGAFLAIIHR